MSIEIYYGCIVVGIIAMFILFLGFVKEEEQRMEEVKIYDGEGNLKKVLSPQKLQKEHWHRFHNSTRFGDQKNKTMEAVKEEVSLQE